jgi:predicted ribosome quality control (RQC) complex YloA/Tae2 family protein
MRRIPKKGEVSGGIYAPLPASAGLALSAKNYSIRDFPEKLLVKLPAGASFNQKIDAFYKHQGGALSLEVLREETRKRFEGNIDRINAILEKLKEKEADFSNAEQYKEQADKILAELGPGKNEAALQEVKSFYEKYKKAKSGLEEIRRRIEEEKKALSRQEEFMDKILLETNPLVLQKQLKSGFGLQAQAPGSFLPRRDLKRPGLSFHRGLWLIMVGRDARENDALLRKYVKGNDLWLHVRDFPGSYVFIKNISGKTVPLEILLDAGNLAVFYSKGRNSGKAELFYTQVKYLRRTGKKGLVIPTQEKNLSIKLDNVRLREILSDLPPL